MDFSNATPRETTGSTMQLLLLRTALEDGPVTPQQFMEAMGAILGAEEATPPEIFVAATVRGQTATVKRVGGVG